MFLSLETIQVVCFLLSGLTWGVSNQECESILQRQHLGRLIAPKKPEMRGFVGMDSSQD